MKKILIAGSKGFIGQHLSEHLIKDESYEVWGCDVINDYNAVNYFVIDASDSNFEHLFQAEIFDLCINCSGAASVPDSFQNPFRDYLLNTVNVFRLLESIRKYAPDCKFLNISSAAVYGNPEGLPISESHPVKPLSPYGWHKYQSELICREYFEFYGIQTCSVRIFSAYGVGLKKQLFWDWYQKAMLNQKVGLLGTGDESRDFIYIDDLVRAIICVIRNGTFKAEVINVANGEESFIRDAAEVFSRLLEGRFRYYFSNTVRVGDPLNWKADISRLNALGYKKQVEFEEGIKRYISWVEGAK
jgi:dTDP-glucose 4,6-dehydratase/UDP-glucose 4-epimerase